MTRKSELERHKRVVKRVNARIKLRQKIKRDLLKVKKERMARKLRLALRFKGRKR